MSLNLVYGKQLQSNFLDAGEALSKDVTEGKFCEVTKKINNTFFDGGVFAPKSFTSLASITIPDNPTHIANELDGHSYVTINKKTSYSAVGGFVEGIPLIGSVLAVIRIIGNLLSMWCIYSSLKHAVKELKNTERSAFNVGRGASCHYTKKVFEAALEYTLCQNELIGSLLALIPLVKPITRLTQGIIFNLRANNGVPVHA